MKKFLVLYRAPISAAQQMAGTKPEQVKAGMEAWMAWMEKAGSAIVDMGAPLGNGKTLETNSMGGSNGSPSGYSVLQADSIETISELLHDHPHLRMPGFSIEVFESLAMPGH